MDHPLQHPPTTLGKRTAGTDRLRTAVSYPDTRRITTRTGVHSSGTRPTLTVAQHLRLFQVAYRLPRLDHAWELMDLLGFGGERRTRAGELSGGTRQKLNLTLALMHDPPLLVLDEPYQGFDWDTHQRFWQLAGRLRSQGRSVVVVSHLLHDLQHFDTVHHLRDGRLHEEGVPR
ncbi:hypothetical protein BGM19_02260 [Streptomyces agglomeratus]|uniref:ATP-binding cassette domain-containing protein n=1 Tax=Streptomyces agglomeratus TaxID=285458 RepID=UPI0008688C06|nr:ATP-binding cassette domain-containing protein [Streptomyces agglomeratus]OEJ62740.1 hypothetical protein BGM19_02260 [Streptomyces agglomeratus]